MTADSVEVERMDMLMVVLGVGRRVRETVHFVCMDPIVIWYSRCDRRLRRAMGCTHAK
jgi:hypothetical protein